MIIVLNKRAAHMGTGKKKISKRARIEELTKNGSIEVKALQGPSLTQIDLRGYLFRFQGALAKLPSTTNHRMITVPRQHILKMLYGLKGGHSTVSMIIEAVKNLRGYITKNEEQSALLQVMTDKVKSQLGDNPRRLAIDKENRGIVLILLGPACNRSDTHNMPKAVCDWMEDLGVLSNDRYVDVFARRKVDMGMTSESSDVLVMLYDQERFDLVKEVFEILISKVREGELLYRE